MGELAGKGDTPLYYLSYRVRDGVSYNMSASYGVLTSPAQVEEPLAGRARILDVATRVGSPKLDNTHRMGGMGGGGLLPIDNDPGALQLALWRATSAAYMTALMQITRVRANKTINVSEDDDADDFSPATPQVHLEPSRTWVLDRAAWADRLRRASALFKDHPRVIESSIALEGGSWTSYFVDSDGARIRVPYSFVRILVTGTVKADDGMDLHLHQDFEATAPEDLPDETKLQAAVTELIARLEALRTAPVVEPYSGPAIMINRAAAVYFHEIFGHRIEGHRQKDSEEGRTFTRRVGQPVMPAFISITDDPTREKFGSLVLNGHYAFDDEGVAAQPVNLVNHGVLKAFLMGRSPIRGFPVSNGHGRAQPGARSVARQGNLIVSSSKAVPFDQLRQQLIDEVKRRGKPFGLMFEDISGGFTTTRTGPTPQAFKVEPLVVKRVYTDGRPDELVRGVEVIGTPLQSLEKILATGDDDAVFNGYCGAESGWVPVSAVAPSVLVSEMEVERVAPNQERPPLLPPPLHPTAWTPPPAGAL
jgi:predicted Zn-dependent protease